MKLLAIALRDLRGASSRLRVFLLCVMLGVAGIAAVGLVIRAAREGIRREASALIGGDLSIRTIYQPVSPEARRYIDARARTTEHVTLRTMATGRSAAGASAPDGLPARQLVELKAVDPGYPLRGELRFAPAMPKQAALGLRNGRYGVAVEQDLLDTLGLKLGDTLMLGSAAFDIRATLAQEPDRLTNSFSLGPHALIAREALATTGLVQWGSLLYYRLAVALPDPSKAAAFADDIRRFDDGGWEIAGLSDAAPGLRRAIDRLSLFLGFVSVATLLIGGIGIAGATSAYFQSRLLTIARLKCAGATRPQVIAIYLTQLLLLTGIATLGGLALGVGLEYLLLAGYGDRLPVTAASGVYAAPLGMAAAFGFAASLAFGLPSLWRAAKARAVSLLRDAQAHALPSAPMAAIVCGLIGAGVLLQLTIRFTGQRALSLEFAAAIAAAAALLWAISAGVTRLARALARPGRSAGMTRLTLAALSRPGAMTRSVLLGMGLGASLMVTIALISLNFHRQLTFDRAEDMPAFFLIDIPKADVAPLEAALHAIPGVAEVKAQPMLRGRIAAINGRPVHPERVDPAYRWMLSNERGISDAATLPSGSRVSEGAWWPEGYAGPPLVSLAGDAARGVGIALGDTVTFAFLGREVTARVANFREINWSSLQMNFSILLSPGAFGDLSVNELATVKAADAAHGPVLRLLAERYPAVTVIRLRETLQQVAGLFDQISAIVAGVAAESLFVGLLVILGALSASLSARRYETVLLGVLGQTRADMRALLRREFGWLIGLAVLLSLGIGSATARLLAGRMMLPRFLYPWEVYAAAILLAIPLCLALSAFAARRLLGSRPLDLLRNE